MDTKQMTEEVRRICGDGEFRPFAFFDERLNRIFVLVKDCSVMEDSVDAILTVFEDNYPNTPDKKYVGFAIDGARRFYSENGLPIQSDVELADVLDALVATCPKHASLVDEHLRPLIARFRYPIVERPRPAS